MLCQKRRKTVIVMDVMFFPRATQDAAGGVRQGGVAGRQRPVAAFHRPFCHGRRRQRGHAPIGGAGGAIGSSGIVRDSRFPSFPLNSPKVR